MSFKDAHFPPFIIHLKKLKKITLSLVNLKIGLYLHDNFNKLWQNTLYYLLFPSSFFGFKDDRGVV